jgi:hypothetical protein
MKTLLLAGSILFGGIFGANQGVDIVRNHRATPEMVEEHAPLKEYAASILEGVDVDQLDAEELEALRAELQILLAEKAAELGIELPEGFEFFQSAQHGLLMQELMAYFQELRAELDWASLTPEERVEALATIKALVQDRAVELGIDRPVMGGQSSQQGVRGPQGYQRGTQGKNARVNPSTTEVVPSSTNTL